MNVGFVGLGAMGLPMARSLIRAGHSVSAYNRTRARAEAAGSEGARVAITPGDTARGVEAVITMVSDDAALEDVVFGAEGILGCLERGAAHISMSTISVALSKRLSAAHRDKEQAFLAAPVFGRPEAAEAQELWIVAGGGSAEIERFRPLFQAMGRGVSELAGEPSRANAVKLGGNFLIASMLEAFGESFALARKSGVEAQQFLDIVNTALFNSPLYANYGSRIAQEAFEPAGFKLRLGLKDVKLALEAGEAAAVPLPLASLIRDHFLAAIAHGAADQDWSALARVSARSAGLD